MGGRGKSSRAAKARAPISHAKVQVISLEELEAAGGGRFADESTDAIAAEIEALVRDLLGASAADFDAKNEDMARALAQAAHEMKHRPTKERAAFSARLAPLFEQLREQAGGGS